MFHRLSRPLSALRNSLRSSNPAIFRQGARRTFAAGPPPEWINAVVLASGALGALTFAYAGIGGSSGPNSSKQNLGVQYRWDAVSRAKKL